MALNFPTSPVDGQVYTSGNLSYQWKISSNTWVPVDSISPIATAAFNKANSANITADAAFATANATNLIANLAYDKANTANVIASGGYDKANIANVFATSAFAQANAANLVANLAFDKANTANVFATAAFAKANSANITADAAFARANAANLVANLAYDKANTANVFATAAFGAQNVTSAVANAAFATANSAVLKTGNTMTGNLVMSSANIAFVTAVNSGIYWTGTGSSFIHSPAANTLVFGTAFAEDMRIDSSGNVGIGTSSPTFRLVVGNSTTDGIWLYSSGANSIIGLGGYSGAADGASGILYERATGQISFRTGTRDTPSTRMVIDNSGQVGVGTTSPGTKLHVVGAIGAAGGGDALPAAAGAGITMYYDTGNDYGVIASLHNGTAWKTLTLRSSGLIFKTSGDVEAARITSAGLFGIGTSSPAATLDIVGSVTDAKANVLSQTLTDGASIAWDASLGRIATVTLGGARSISNATNVRVGTYILRVQQNTTSGGSTLTWGRQYKFTANVTPTLTATANAVDIFSFVSDGTNLYGAMIPDVRS